MDVIEATGDPRSIGRAIGERGAEAIHQAVMATPQFQRLQVWHGTDRMAELRAAARASYPEHLEEIAGIAEGAGVDEEALFIWNCRGDNDGLESTVDDACTSLLLPATDDHPATIAHNEDGAPEFAGLCFMVRARPEKGPAFEAFCYPGMLPGHAFGANEHGIVQTINHIRPGDRTVGVPRHIVSRAVLSAQSLEAALAILERTDRAAGFHHNIGDAASGRLFSVEAPASGCSVVEALTPMAHANHLVHEKFAGLKQLVTPSSEARQVRAETVVGDLAAEPLSVLFDTAGEDLPVLCRGEVGSGDSYTLATVLYQLSTARIACAVHHGPALAPVVERVLPVHGGKERHAAE
ncbi:MAG: peptidase C45 [Rhodospirillaceae bacterium]|nr:peptidase C45 [Rhodospirillaceae bacterium]MBT6139319.1 peptidase C45 [Rhodospirillaceae bacterium]